MIKLTKKEKDTFDKIVKCGTMDDMFEIGYAIGRERFASEQLEVLKHKEIIIQIK